MFCLSYLFEGSNGADGMEKRRIILARHGATELNDDGDKIRGWKDVPLNQHGKDEAEALGDRLKKEDFDFIISSNLSRAEETAKIVAKITEKPFVGATQGLRPWNLGVYTSAPATQVMEHMKEYVVDHPDKKVDGGESFNDFKNRFFDEVIKILEKYPDKVPLIVAHHRNDRLLDAWKGDKDVDLKTFLSRGITPGQHEIYYVYV